MRFHLLPRSLLQIVTAILLAPIPLTTANPAPVPSIQAGFSYHELFARWDCGGTYCGYSSQLCCTGGAQCYTDALSQAQCGAVAAATTTAVAADGGYWTMITTIYTETDLQTITSVVSSYVGAAATSVYITASPTALSCPADQQSCGSLCCASDQYCYTAGQCLAAANGASSAPPAATTAPLMTTYYSTMTSNGVTALAPIIATISSNTVLTVSETPTTTVPFIAPVATGANVTLTSSESNSGGGLSGGAIAGIVIGVLLGLALLGLICFYCCLKGLLDGVLALFGLGGRKKRRVTEVEEYERRSSHRHGSGGGGRTWYGASRPARVDRYDERKSNTGKELLGLGAGLGALWAFLGMKRKREDRRRFEEKSDVSYSSDYYTSASE